MLIDRRDYRGHPRGHEGFIPPAMEKLRGDNNIDLVIGYAINRLYRRLVSLRGRDVAADIELTSKLAFLPSRAGADHRAEPVQSFLDLTFKGLARRILVDVDGPAPFLGQPTLDLVQTADT